MPLPTYMCTHPRVPTIMYALANVRREEPAHKYIKVSWVQKSKTAPKL